MGVFNEFIQSFIKGMGDALNFNNDLACVINEGKDCHNDVINFYSE